MISSERAAGHSKLQGIINQSRGDYFIIHTHSSAQHIILCHIYIKLSIQQSKSLEGASLAPTPSYSRKGRSLLHSGRSLSKPGIMYLLHRWVVPIAEVGGACSKEM